MHDPKKIEDAVLALFGVFEFDDGRNVVLTLDPAWAANRPQTLRLLLG